MGRLIDADAWIDELNNVVSNKDMPMSARSWAVGMIAHIKQRQTAYDVKKVVKEIHNYKCQKCRNILGIFGADEYCESQHCQVYQICKIVRKGGVNE